MHAPYPKLLYLGDVPIENTVYGAALLYRLLVRYPAGDVVVLEPNGWRSRPDQRLQAVRYISFPLGNSRLLNSRLRAFYGLWLLTHVTAKWKCIDSLLKPFTPQAVITVTHGYSWLAAAEYALQKNLPLHLILHDEWPGHDLVVVPFRSLARHLFRTFYHAAANRLCISPYMAEVYRKEFSVPAGVLYPCSDTIVEPHSAAQEAALRQVTNPVVGFGGTLSAGQARALRIVAQALAGCGGKLLIYGPITRDRARSLRLDLANVEFRGLVSSAEMIRAFRQTADFLIIPQSFLPSDRRQTVMSFPSKIADYTAVGRPLLIVAPQYSSLVQWCAAIQGIAEIVTAQDPVRVTAAVQRLMSSPQHRQRLAHRAQQIHGEYFSHARTWSKFSGALQGTQSSTGASERLPDLALHDKP